MTTGAPHRTQSKGHPPQVPGGDIPAMVEPKDDLNELEDGGQLDEDDPRSTLSVSYSTLEGGKFDTKVEGPSSTVVVVAGVLGEAVCVGLEAYHPAATFSAGVGAAAIFGMVALYVRKCR